MKTILTFAILFVSANVFANTATFTVKGMHCAACKESVEEKVCKDAKINEATEKCEVSIVDEKKEIGQVVIVSKKDKKVDVKAVEKAVKAAGTSFKVTKKDIK